MKRTTRNKIIVYTLVGILIALIGYFLIFKAVLGDAGLYIGGVGGFLILAAFIGTAAKSKEQLDRELKHMSKIHDNHRPKRF